MGDKPVVVQCESRSSFPDADDPCWSVACKLAEEVQERLRWGWCIVLPPGVRISHREDFVLLEIGKDVNLCSLGDYLDSKATNGTP